MNKPSSGARLGIVILTVFVDLLGFGIIIPLMPSWAESYGASPFVYGLLAASYSLMQFIFVPIWGRLSDRWGRRPILLLSIAGSAVSFTLLGMARSLGALFTARILSGISAANLSAAQAYVADITAPEDRARGMGLVGAAFGLGFVVGPFVGGELSPFSWSLPLGLSIREGTAPFFLAGLLSVANWISAYRLLPESLAPERRQTGNLAARPFFSFGRLRLAMNRSEVRPLLIISFLSTVAISMMEQTLILFGERRLEMTPMGAGRFLGYAGVLMVITQGFLVGRLVRHYGERAILKAGLLLAIPGLFLIAPVRSYLALGLAMIPLALGSGLGSPSLHALLSRNSRHDEQGGVLGINQSLSSLARVVGPPFGGYLFQTLGIGSPYLIGALVAAAAAFLALAALRPASKDRQT